MFLNTSGDSIIVKLKKKILTENDSKKIDNHSFYSKKEEKIEVFYIE